MSQKNSLRNFAQKKTSRSINITSRNLSLISTEQLNGAQHLIVHMQLNIHQWSLLMLYVNVVTIGVSNVWKKHTGPYTVINYLSGMIEFKLEMMILIYGSNLILNFVLSVEFQYRRIKGVCIWPVLNVDMNFAGFVQVIISFTLQKLVEAYVTLSMM